MASTPVGALIDVSPDPERAVPATVVEFQEKLFISLSLFPT
jgi:hypothetical protein